MNLIIGHDPLATFKLASITYTDIHIDMYPCFVNKLGSLPLALYHSCATF